MNTDLIFCKRKCNENDFVRRDVNLHINSSGILTNLLFPRFLLCLIGIEIELCYICQGRYQTLRGLSILLSKNWWSRLVECCSCFHKVCENCTRRCECCQELFCSICATYKYDALLSSDLWISYENRYDEILCMDCMRETHKQAVPMKSRSYIESKANTVSLFNCM